MDFGIASVAAITVIAYLVGIGCKAAGSVKDELIPVICGCVGAGRWHRVRSCSDWRKPDLQAADQNQSVRGGDPHIPAAPSVNGTNDLKLSGSLPEGFLYEGGIKLWR